MLRLYSEHIFYEDEPPDLRQPQLYDIRTLSFHASAQQIRNLGDGDEGAGVD